MPSSHPRHARASSPAPGALAPLSLEGIPLGNIYADSDYSHCFPLSRSGVKPLTYCPPIQFSISPLSLWA